MRFVRDRLVIRLEKELDDEAVRTLAGDFSDLVKKGAIEKGPMRYAQGVGVATGDYATGVGPSLEVIARTDLPARGVTGSEQNYTRSSTIGKALRAAKLAR
jgi:hypothetical protein